MLKEYLEADLSVPTNHIRILTDAAATRTAILSALYDLRDNAEIQRGDAMIIHYSGHGASYEADEFHDNTVDAIEAICPVDRGVEDPCQGTVLDISDREINLFLSELCRTKGDNITLILDCCFSPAVPRPSPSVFISRGAPPLLGSLQSMLHAAENNPRKRWAAGAALTPDWIPDVSSYVVLAACQDYERAWECSDGKGGDFTIALLHALRAYPPHTLTYADLISHIGRLRRQQPCAVGSHIGRSIFNYRPGLQYVAVSRKAERHATDVDHPVGQLVRLLRRWLTWLGW
jgi:hypothetical protein